MTDYTSTDILDFAANQQPLKVGSAFDALMRDRVSDMIASHQETYGQQVFNSSDDNEDEQEFDLPEDDLDDFDLDGLDDELEDLDDFDLDGEVTDEDA